jgi:hypothetical protein
MAKELVDCYRALDVRKLRPELLVPGGKSVVNFYRGSERAGSIGLEMRSEQVVLRYHTERRDGTWEEIAQPVSIVFSRCNFGGRRPWFLCPVCKRRVAILYAAGYFRCRSCLKLAYESQR